MSNHIHIHVGSAKTKDAELSDKQKQQVKQLLSSIKTKANNLDINNPSLASALAVIAHEAKTLSDDLRR